MIYPDRNNIILDVRGALWFLENLPEERWETIDTIVLDPPYYDSDKKTDVEKVNSRTKLKKPSRSRIRVKYFSPHTRLMNSFIRRKIIGYIKYKMNEDTRVLHFHSVRDRLPKLENFCCDHEWIKPIKIVMTGNNDRKNIEYIRIEGPKIEGNTMVGRTLNQAIVNCEPEMIIGNKAPTIVRACAKPEKLFIELFRHLDSRHVLDPFAGWGRSISAALKMGLKIDACDSDVLDPRLKKQYNIYKSMEYKEYVQKMQTTIDYEFE
ncbi:MAG: hypothetical protein V3V19_11150 [Cocleimonas sp.]